MHKYLFFYLFGFVVSLVVVKFEDLSLVALMSFLSAITAGVTAYALWRLEE